MIEALVAIVGFVIAIPSLLELGRWLAEGLRRRREERASAARLEERRQRARQWVAEHPDRELPFWYRGLLTPAEEAAERKASKRVHTFLTFVKARYPQ